MNRRSAIALMMTVVVALSWTVVARGAGPGGRHARRHVVGSGAITCRRPKKLIG